MAGKDDYAAPLKTDDEDTVTLPFKNIRILLPDPHAIGSSSDDDDCRGPANSSSLKRPRVVQDILLNINNGDESTSTKEADPTLTTLNKFRGAHRRKSGRWSAEVTDPFNKRRIWLGTFDTPEEASNVYAAKRLEFRERKKAQSCMDRTRPECESGRRGEEINAGQSSGRILIDNNGFLLGEFSNLDDDLRIS